MDRGARETEIELRFSVGARIARPVAEVFEAVADPAQLSRYFTTGGAEGRLETGAVVTWDFHDFPGAFPVYVVEVERNRRIVLQWDADEGTSQAGEHTGEHAGEHKRAAAADPTSAPPEPSTPVGSVPYRTTVTLTFEPLDDGRTLVTISEEGWRPTPGGLRASYGNCGGWMQMLCAMKAHLEYGINLREGMFA